MPREGRGGGERAGAGPAAFFMQREAPGSRLSQQEEQQPRTPWGTLRADQRGCRLPGRLHAGSLPSRSWQGSWWPPAPPHYCQTTKLCHLVKLYSAGSLYRYTSWTKHSANLRFPPVEGKNQISSGRCCVCWFAVLQKACYRALSAEGSNATASSLPRASPLFQPASLGTRQRLCFSSGPRRTARSGVGCTPQQGAAPDGRLLWLLRAKQVGLRRHSPGSLLPCKDWCY